MGFLATISPAEADAARMISLTTMAVVIGVGLVPPLQPYAHRIRVAAAAAYLACVLGFVIYYALFR